MQWYIHLNAHRPNYLNVKVQKALLILYALLKYLIIRLYRFHQNLNGACPYQVLNELDKHEFV